MPSAEKITELTAYAAPLSTDVVPVVDLTGPTTKKATIAALIGAAAPKTHAASHAAGGSDPVTLTEAQITGLVADLALKAALASPALTGSPTAPTQAGGDSSTKLATTAFVAALATTTSAAGAVPKAGVNGNLAPGWLRRKLATNTDSGTQNNWAPGVDGDTFLPWAGIADLAVTGLAGGVVGDTFIFKNTGTKIATFTHQSGSSSAGNKFRCPITSAPVPVAPQGVVVAVHDGTDWLMIAHEQGTPISPAFSAGAFTGLNSMTWTVDAGDVQGFLYVVDAMRGLMTVFCSLNTTTVGGVADTQLRVTIPGGFTSALPQVNAGGRVSDNGAETVGLVFVSGSGGTLIQVMRYPTLTAYALSTNNTVVQFTITIQVN